MKTEDLVTKIAKRLVLMPVLALFFCGCQRDAERADEVAGKPRLCGFKEGRGVFLGEETQRAIGVQAMEVVQKRIPQTIRGTARLFVPGKASLPFPAELARAIKPGQRVLFSGGSEGEVVSIDRASGTGGDLVEVIIAVNSDEANTGMFISTTLEVGGREPLPAVPESSLLSTATGDYVFVRNGDHFLRTQIKRAGSNNGWVAVADGLLEGDIVVTQGVQGLWCIELQATKGGYACCAVAKKE